MDFVLQFGEFYSEGDTQNMIWMFLATLVAPIVALLIYCNSIRKENKLRRDELDLFQKYVYLHTNSAILLARDLISNNKKYADNLSNEPLKQHPLDLKPLASLERLTDLEKDKLLKVFLNVDEGSSQYNKFIKHSDYLLSVFQLLYQIHMEGNDKSVIEMSNNVFKLAEVVKMQLIKAVGDYNNDFTKLTKTKISYILNEYCKIDKIGLEPNNEDIFDPNNDIILESKDKLFDPIIDILIDSKEEHINDYEVIINCKDALSNIITIEKFNKFTSKSISGYYGIVNKSCKELEEIVNKLK